MRLCSAASFAQCTWMPFDRAFASNCSRYWSRWVSVCSLIAEASERNSSHSAMPCISRSRFCRKSHSRSSCIFSCSGAAMKRAAASAWSIGRLPWTLAPRGCGSGLRVQRFRRSLGVIEAMAIANNAIGFVLSQQLGMQHCLRRVHALAPFRICAIWMNLIGTPMRSAQPC